MDIDPHEHTTSCWWSPDQASWTCTRSRTEHDTAPAVGPDPALVDVRDMVVVHIALLREFRLAAPAVGRVPPADTRQAAAVDRHLGFLCDLLHHHHAG
jgi:hypothetical protein